jgi:hypothetical protein
MTAALGFVLWVETEMEQSIVVLACDHHHVAAPASVAAARATARDEFLAPESQAAVAAVTGLDRNSYFIDE